MPCKDLKNIPGLRVRTDLPLAGFTSFRIGGPARCFLVPGDLLSLENTLEYLHGHDIPFYVIGQGTNLLVSDRGVKTVLSLSGLTSMTCVPDSGSSGRVLVSADAGVKIRRLLAWAVRSGLGGLENLAGIPASLGGAVRMNAGNRHGAINEVLTHVRLTGAGGSRWVRASSLRADYRSLTTPRGVLISGARLSLISGARESLSLRVRRIMAARIHSQPLGMASAGCVFKNPAGDSAGRLIDMCGLKGKSAGGARISPKHANFIVNTGCGKAVDVARLMAFAREQVCTLTGIELEPEISIWGEDVKEIFN